MKLNFFVILIIIIVTIFSYLYSDKTYSFYTKIYYTYIKKSNYDNMINKAKKLFNNKKYHTLKDHLELMDILFPRKTEIKRIKGLNYIRLGMERKGALIILSTLENRSINPRVLNEAVRILFNNELYGDIIFIYRKNGIKNDLKLLFYYGISFYKMNKFREALQIFNRISVRREINLSYQNRSKLHFYKGACYEEMNKLPEALDHFKSALKFDKRNMENKKAMVRIYRKLKRYNEAERVLLTF